MTATKTTSRRIPKTLKKKLEASLKSLTPREAARLWLIYFHEYTDKGFEGDGLPHPLQELEDALDKQYEAAAHKGTEEANRQAHLHNGYLLLKAIAGETLIVADRELWRLSSQTNSVEAFLNDTLTRDAFGQLANDIEEKVSRDLPKPVSRDEYARLMRWATEDGHWEIGRVTEMLLFYWATAQGFVNVDYYDAAEELKTARPDEIEAIRAREDREDLSQIDRDLRRLYADFKGEAWAKDVFKEDQAALDDWVTRGGWAGPGLTTEVLQRKEAELTDRLIGMIKAGELRGGEAVALGGCYESIPVEAGTIPTWAALRSLWKDWLVDHDYLGYFDIKIDPQSVGGIMGLYTIDGPLVDEDLVNVVAEFVAEYRAKPWGDGIATDIDLTRLSRFLIEAEVAGLTDDVGEALQLGRVNLQAFKEAEGDRPFDNEDIFWVAIVGGLRARAADLGLSLDDIDMTAQVEDRFYIARDPSEKRRELQSILDRLYAMQINRRPLGSDRSRPYPLAFLGVEFVNPLEEVVKALGKTFSELATFDQIVNELSDEYFAGMPLLLKRYQDRHDHVEEWLSFAEKRLNSWLEKLAAAPWDIDVTPLKLVKPPVDRDLADEWKTLIIDAAKRRFNRPDILFDLGPDDPPAKKKKTAGKKEDRHE